MTPTQQYTLNLAKLYPTMESFKASHPTLYKSKEMTSLIPILTFYYLLDDDDREELTSFLLEHTEWTEEQLDKVTAILEQT